MAHTYTYANDTIKKVLLFDNSHKDDYGRTVYKQMPFCLVYFVATDGKTMKGPYISLETMQTRVLNSNALAGASDPPIDIIGIQMITAPGRHAGWPQPNGHFFKGI